MADPSVGPILEDVGPAAPGGKADSTGQAEFFADDTFYYVKISSWPRDRMAPNDLREEQSFAGSEVRVYRADPNSPHHCPDVDVTDADLVHRADDFGVRITGNFTLGTPKSSFKIGFGGEDRLFGMRALNLKSMWNDVSQMRESIAWTAFAEAGVHAPRHTYARLCINDRYYGLFSVIEQVDKSFLETHFGDNDEGNLYKAYWSDLGPATLERRVDASGDDSGRQYFRDEVFESTTSIAIADARRNVDQCGGEGSVETSTKHVVPRRLRARDVRVEATIHHERPSDLEVVIVHERRDVADRDRFHVYPLFGCADDAAGELVLGDVVAAPFGPGGEWTLRVRDRKTGAVGTIDRFVVRLLNRSYEQKTNDDVDDPAAMQSYDDLARLIRVIDGVGIPGGEGRFDTDAYRDSVRAIFDVDTFLRWASANVLLGAWDNYWRTPANYYLYNSGREGGRKRFMEQPYFHFVPWDYDNSLGTDFVGIEWQYANIVDWEANSDHELPLVDNLLRNREFRRYYLDHLEYLLDRMFNERWLGERIGSEGSGGLWDRVRPSAYFESDFEHGPQHTGRRFTNHQVYQNGFQHEELPVDGGKILGILHYMRMRHDRARAQLRELRASDPRGASGAVFPAVPGPLP